MFLLKHLIELVHPPFWFCYLLTRYLYFWFIKKIMYHDGVKTRNQRRKEASSAIDGERNIKNGVFPTMALDSSDFSFSVRQACSLNSCRNNGKVLLAPLIQKREIGPNFSIGQRCNINNNFLPNYMYKIAKHSNMAFCGIFSEDGKFLLTTIHDKYMKLYTSNYGKYKEYKKYPVSGVGWSVLDVAFNPNGTEFVYSSWSNNLYKHSLYGDSHQVTPLLLNVDLPMFCVFSLKYSSDGREIICGGNDGSLYIYDQGSESSSKIKGVNNQVNSIALADSSSQILYTAGDDGLCKVWDRRTLNEENPVPVGILAGHVSGITYVDPRGDGRHLITNSKDQTIKLWDTRVFARKSAVECARVSVVFANLSWDYRWQHVPKKLISATMQPIPGDTSVMTYRSHVILQTLIRCHFSPSFTTGNRYIYTGCASGAIIIYDVLTGRVIKKLQRHKYVVRDVSWHPYHTEIVSSSWDGVVASWRYKNQSTDIQADKFCEKHKDKVLLSYSATAVRDSSDSEDSVSDD